MFVSDNLGSPIHYLQTSIVIGKLGKDGCRFTKSYVFMLEILKFYASNIKGVSPKEGGCMKAAFRGYM
jgi:hypothetical protein